VLFRVFRAVDGAPPSERGGALHVPRDRQGSGRHDSPGRYGAFYAARSSEAAVAEVIQAFRGRDLEADDLVAADGSPLALARLEDDALGPLTDLDEPAILVDHAWRPSAVASRSRAVTQPMAARLFDDGAAGLSWWSTLDAAWTNVTLFAERAIALGDITVASVEALTLSHPAVVAAADHLAILTSTRRRRRRR